MARKFGVGTDCGKEIKPPTTKLAKCSLIPVDCLQGTSRAFRHFADFFVGGLTFAWRRHPDLNRGNRGFAVPCLTSWLCRHVVGASSVSFASPPKTRQSSFSPPLLLFRMKPACGWALIRAGQRARAEELWSGQRDSNSLPPPWQGGALPNELRPRRRSKLHSAMPVWRRASALFCCTSSSNANPPSAGLRVWERTWCLRSESNQRHADFQSAALPSELQRRILFCP